MDFDTSCIVNDLKQPIQIHKINPLEDNKINPLEDNEIIQLILISNNVFLQLGKGFNECIYHKALLVDLYKSEYNIETEKIIPILFNNICVGHVKTDIIIETSDLLIIIELKALDRDINYKEEIQIKKYIKHINKQKKIIGLIINFSQKNNECLEVQSKIIN
jgi:GxxExxY protein